MESLFGETAKLKTIFVSARARFVMNLHSDAGTTLTARTCVHNSIWNIFCNSKILVFKQARKPYEKMQIGTNYS